MPRKKPEPAVPAIIEPEESGPGLPVDIVPADGPGAPTLAIRESLADWILAHDPSKETPPGAGRGLPKLTPAEARYLRERVADPGVPDSVVMKRARVSTQVARSARVMLWLQAMQADLEGELEALAGESAGRLRALVLARLAREACYAMDARVAALAAKVFLDHVPPPREEDADLRGLSTEALRARIRNIAKELLEERG